jgi:hypothetical protein
LLRIFGFRSVITSQDQLVTTLVVLEVVDRNCLNTYPPSASRALISVILIAQGALSTMTVRECIDNEGTNFIGKRPYQQLYIGGGWK